MKKLSKVSIIIACYNDPFVIQAIEAATAQTYPNKEIIVVNDGSNSITGKCIDSVKRHINILLRQKNKGQGAARNKGISKAEGEYILNWDSDDYFEPDFCEKAIKEFEKDKKVKIVTCWTSRFNSSREIDIFKPRGGTIESFLFNNSALGSSMFKRSDWENIEGYDETPEVRGFEDWEFYLRMLKNGGYAYVIPEVLFNYRVRKGSTTALIKNNKTEKFKYIILKHPQIYKAHFEELVLNIFEKMNLERREKFNRENSLEYRLGTNFLKPLRFFKKLFKK